MKCPDKKIVDQLKKDFPAGCRIVLDKMDDPQAPPVGTQGTVLMVDDTGSIIPSWDKGGCLSVVYGVDLCHKVSSEEELMISLQHYAKEQTDDSWCPRCGMFMQGKLHTHALSRRMDIYVCDTCGMIEALEDFGAIKEKKSLMEWDYVKRIRRC